MTFEDGCAPCKREFLSESARSQHHVLVHGSDDAREFSGKERKKAAGSGAALKDGSFPIKTTADLKNAIAAYGRAKDKAKAKAHIIARAKALGATNLLPEGWAGSDKAELMHACDPCSRPFAGERSLFQHAAAVHGYDEATDRAGTVGTNPAGGVRGAPDFLLGLAPWEEGDRRFTITYDRQTGVRTLKDFDAKYETASHQSGTHGSSTSVSGLSCGVCTRSFHTVRALTDNAEAVHDSALDATYEERQQLVSNALRKQINSANSYNRIYVWVSDMTDTFAVYQVEGMEDSHQVTYTISDDGVVTLGDHVAVRRRTVYEPIGSTT